MPAASEALATIVRDHTSRKTYSESDIWYETASAMEVVEKLLTKWDDDLADEWFAINMDLDQPRNERAAIFTTMNSGSEAISRVPGSLSTTTPAHAKWQVSSDSGLIEIEILMSPTKQPKIQTLKVAKTPQWDGICAEVSKINKVRNAPLIRKNMDVQANWQHRTE